MDWLRRNWADVAIGTGLVAVIAGIALTLVTGGSFFPGSPAPAPRAAGTTQQPAAVEVPLEPGSAAAADAPSPVGEVPAASFEQPDVAEFPAAPAAPSAPAVTPVPLAPAPAAAPAAAALPTSAPAPAAPTTPAPAAPAAAPARPTAPATSIPAASRDPEAPFRVSVGAFTVRGNAERQRDVVRSLGYPAFIGEQDGLSIVLVGPFDDLAVARSVSARLATADLGVEPIVYRLQSDAESAAARAEAAQAAATPSPAAPAPAPTPTPLVTAPSGRSLQVHAVADADAASREVARLRSLGYPAYAVREGGLSKVLIGPFDETNLAAARTRLDAEGISSFPR